MSRSRTVALFLSTLALAGGTVACSHSPEAGEKGDDKEKPALSQPSGAAPSNKHADEKSRDEGGEGGEG